MKKWDLYKTVPVCGLAVLPNHKVAAYVVQVKDGFLVWDLGNIECQTFTNFTNSGSISYYFREEPVFVDDGHYGYWKAGKPEAPWHFLIHDKEVDDYYESLWEGNKRLPSLQALKEQAERIYGKRG